MKKFTPFMSLQLAALSVGLLGVCRPAQATDYVWSGNGATASTDWFSTKNWKVSNLARPAGKISLATSAVEETATEIGFNDRISGVPGAGDTATIAAGSVVTINTPLTLSVLTIQEGSRLQGTGDITITSSLTLRDAQLSGDGDILIAPNSTVVVSGQKSGATGNILEKSIDNRGTLNWTSGKLSLQKDFHNRGDFIVAADASMQAVETGKVTFYNEGTLTKSGKDRTSISLPFQNSGDVYLRDGVLDVGPNYVQNDGSLNLDGGNLSSSGTLQISGGVVGGTGTLDCDVVNSGTFKPGHSPGIISINGNYTQTTNGTLGMEVGGTTPGTGYDQMRVSGRVDLAGNLDIQKYNSYMPSVNQNFDFITSWDMHGTFTSFSGLYPGNSLYYRPTMMPDRYNAWVYSDTVAPTISISTPVSNGVYLGVSSIQGTADDIYSGVNSVTVMLYRYATSSTPTGFLSPGNTWSSTYSAANQLLASGTTNWSLALPTLAPGQYHVKATAKDNVGKVYGTSNILFNVSPSGSGYVSLPASNTTRSRLVSILSGGKLRFSKPF